MRAPILILMLMLLLKVQSVYGQKLMSIESEISFFSIAPIEDISAVNTHSKSALDLETRQIVFSVPIKNFEFAKSLMKEHFNEKYLESDKFPNATFNGVFTKSDEDSDMAWAEGMMEIHGVKNKIRVSGQLMQEGELAKLSCKFKVLLEDYNIKIPKLLFQNIAEEIEITILFDYELFEE